jgi:hypothetical protein
MPTRCQEARVPIRANKRAASPAWLTAGIPAGDALTEARVRRSSLGVGRWWLPPRAHCPLCAGRGQAVPPTRRPESPLCDENLPKATTSDLVLVKKMGAATLWRTEGREMEDAMTSTETGSGSADRIVESFHDAGNMALESVRKLHGVVRLQPGGLNQGLGLAAERGP